MLELNLEQIAFVLRPQRGFDQLYVYKLVSQEVLYFENVVWIVS